jgi:ATP-dependent protease ClpP protease subunit
MAMLRVLVALAFVLVALPASAMQFSLVSFGGQRAVLAQGEIKPGDARRLRAALARIGRDRHGTKDLLLDSPGGTVADAWDMADVMDAVGVTTIVPNRAVCASACASVLFVAGRYRVVGKAGRLAIHSCYDARSGGKVEACDAALSVRAARRGVSGIALMAFQELAPGPDSIVVLDARDAACYGLTRAPGKTAAGDNAPCIKAALEAARAHSRPRRRPPRPARPRHRHASRTRQRHLASDAELPRAPETGGRHLRRGVKSLAFPQ